MRFSSFLSYALLPVVLSAVAYPPGDDDDEGYGWGNSSSATPSEGTASTAASSASSGAQGNVTGSTGDNQCSSAMCVAAAVNGATVQYTLQSRTSSNPGWMAMGFGTQMSNAQMVIMWSNSDGSVTLSQRSATGHVEPTVDSSPVRTATLLSNLTSTTSSTAQFGFSVPANSDTSQSIIWAYSSTNPGDSSVSADIQQHDSYGQFTLDLTKSLSSSSDPASSGTSQSLQRWQKLIVAHAVLLSVAFLIFLPAGALLARWLRTFSPHWFKGHWFIQFYVSGILVIVGFALGIAAVDDVGGSHFDDEHMRWGLAIVLLYFAQCGFGALIHFVKPSPKADGKRTRPPQNYTHAILGLMVIALAFYQVRTGYKDEWPKLGRGDAPDGVNVAWIVWIVILPLSYAAGLILLPRQFRQEAGAQTGRGVPLGPLSTGVPVTRTVHPGGPVTRELGANATGLSPINESRDGLSSQGHGDPYADDVGLTSSGRRNRRNNSGAEGVALPSQRF